FLRSKSIFFASAFASFLLSYMVWKEPTFQPSYVDLAKFATIASTLYLLHLSRSFWRETRGEGEHDQYSGKSHLLKFLPEQSEKNIHLIMEPAITIIAGSIFNGKLGSAV